jgi:serine/threonine-protein kinase SRPK3
LREIRDQDDISNVNEGTMIEKEGTGLDEAEVRLLADLLEKMLRYCPED